MGKKTPKYIVLNKNVGGRFHRPVSGGDDLGHCELITAETRMKLFAQRI